MITVPERPRQEIRNHQTRHQDRPRRQSKPKKPKQKQTKAEPEAEEGWYSIRDIIDEKRERGHVLYLIDWEGTDQNGRRYDPTWQPAANVTAAAINAWRDKKKEKASRAARAPGDNRIPPSPESAQETAPVVLSPARAKRTLSSQRYTKRTPMTSSGDSGERAHKRRRTEASRAASGLQAPRSESSEQRVSPSGDLHAGDPEGDKPPPGHVAQNQGGKLVVELPCVLPIDPSEFQTIASQTSSQATVLEQTRPTRDQRVIPDSQEVSGTSVSGANNSYSQPPNLLLESQQQQDTPPSPAHASSSSTIPSHQPDSRAVVDTSGFFANPDLSTNSTLNLATNLNRSLLHMMSTGPFQGPVDKSNSDFHQTQLERNFVAISSVTASHGTTVPESHSNAQLSQESESQHSYTTNQNSTPSNSQAAQIVPPFISHPGDAVSQGHSDFSVFGEDRTVSETREGDAMAESQDSQAVENFGRDIKMLPDNQGHEPASETMLREGDTIAESQDSSQAVTGFNRDVKMPPDNQGYEPASETMLREGDAMTESQGSSQALKVDGDTKMPTTAQGHEPASSAASPPPATRGSGEPESPQQVQPDMRPCCTCTGNCGRSLEEKYRAHGRRLLDEYFPLPRANTHANGENLSTVHTPLLSPIPQTQIDPIPSDGHAGSRPLDSYDAPPMEPTTLDPSDLTLSIEENVVEDSPSVPTDDDLTPGALGEPSNSDEMEMHVDHPRSLLPRVPTGPYEYLVTLPFQTSSRPQYNDVIRENEALLHEYNASFRTLPFRTPRQQVIEKLDTMFSRLFDMCDVPPFLESVTSMSSEQIAKHVIGTNAKFSFVAELIDNLQAANSDKKVLILVRPGILMDLLGHVILSRGCHYIRSGQEVVGTADAEHALTVSLSSTSDEEPSASADVDAVIVFDHTFHQKLIRSTNQHAPPVILALVNTASIQHLNMRIRENMPPLERKNVLMRALAQAMRHIEEPDHSEPLFSIAEKFARRIQMFEEDAASFYWEPQTIPEEIFDQVYAASFQIDATQLSSQGLGISPYPDSKKRPYADDENDQDPMMKRPKISQPRVVTSSSHISDAIRNLFAVDLTYGPDEATAVVSLDKLQAVADQFAEMKSELEQSKAQENEFRQLSDRAQQEVESFVSSINNIQTKYMDALRERGIFEADCKVAQEQASVLSESLESYRTETTTLKATRTELEKKLAEANNALLNSSNPDLVKMAELEKALTEAKAEAQQLNKRLVVTQSDLDYSKNLYDQASRRATDLSSENRSFENKLQELQRRANQNIIAFNEIQGFSEVQLLTQQVTELNHLLRERTTELSKIRDELKSLRSGRRETRQSSVPRSPRLSSLGGVMSPRNGSTRGPSAMGGPSSSRGTSPQPPTAIFDAPAGSGNGAQNNKVAHLRDQRF
ncbi:hypothetical protein F4679DRAFT_193028 [Xylaria curta]|nr:hypothetical protein F4679DRAFT_193028 [Xylaria curta]